MTSCTAEPPPADHAGRGAAAAGALAGLAPQRAAAVLKLDVTQGNVQPMPIAIPDFVGVATRTPPSGAMSARSSRRTCSAPACSRRSIRPPISRRSRPSTRCRALPTGGRSTPRRWSPAASRQSDGRLKAEFRLWDVFAGQQLRRQAIHHHRRQLAAHRPHHLGRDLRAAHRREGLFRQPRRVRRRVRSEGAADQAARADGSGRRQRALSHARRRPRAHAALLVLARHHHLHVLRPGRSQSLSA